jgi:putative hydrolase
VLGQYEFGVLEPDRPARLLFVAPNLAQAAEALDAEPDQLLRWVALHEMTHALQFGGVPWLRGHLASMLRELLGALQMNPASFLRVPDLTDLRAMLERVREDGLATVMIGPDKRETLDRVQAFMAVLEGYAEHVMDAST